MSRLYSVRGARRGLVLAGIAAALWTGWALGYLQGSGYFDAGAQRKASTTRVHADARHNSGEMT